MPGLLASPDAIDAIIFQNQQYRIDLLRPEAEIDSVAKEDVLATVFRTSDDGLSQLAPTHISRDLTRWTGQTVRIRIVSIDSSGPLRAGVDNIRLVPRSR